MDDFLKSLGFKLKYEELTKAERDQLYVWMDQMQKAVVTLEDVKGYIHTMRDSVENELTKVSNSKEEDYLLKARLRNYMLLEAFLSSPERAKAALKKAAEGIPIK